MERKTIRFELTNGLRVIHSPSNGEIVHCALMINAGTRDEQKDNTGLAHLIEHCIFKGTQSKSSLDILNSIDAVGGELNAYTTKEETCIYVSCSIKYFERALELLADICLNSTFPASEVRKEKDVISDEIHSYLDTPSEQIYDDFEEMLFRGHPLGRNILGAEKKMRALKREDLKGFIREHYHGRNLVFSSSGNIPQQHLKKLTGKYLSRFQARGNGHTRKGFVEYSPQHKVVARKTHQAHCIIGNKAYDSSHKYRTAMILLNNMLGGPAMNSRLNLGIREKYGYTYQLDSSYTAYSDSGIFSIYFGTDPLQLEITQELVLKELRKLRTKKLSTLELNQGKEQLCGQIALAQESRLGNVFQQAKNILLYDKMDPLHIWLKKIRSSTSSQLMEIANEVFDESSLSTLVFKKARGN